MAGDSDDLLIMGSLSGGAAVKFCTTNGQVLPISGIKVPNILQFAERPAVAVNAKLILQNTELVIGFDNIPEYLTVTAAPIQVGLLWEVATNGNWTSNTGSNTLTFQAGTSFPGCNTTPQPKPSAQVCAGSAISANWSGYVYSRPLNSPSIRGSVTVTPSGTTISAKDGNFAPRKGDRVTISGTAITEANPATVVNVTPITVLGKRVMSIELNIPVTGITEPIVDGVACVSAQADPQALAPFTFTAEGNCCVKATLDRSYTSARKWPQGKPVNTGNCPAQEYCYVIENRTPGAEIPVYSGNLILK
jgi:hypothetical protein